jgi:hypothetical protein
MVHIVDVIIKERNKDIHHVKHDESDKQQENHPLALQDAPKE